MSADTTSTVAQGDLGGGAARGQYQFMPALTADEEAGLRESIEQHGVLQEVITDERGVVLDGHNRERIARELDVECPKRVRKGLSHDDKIDLAFQLNLAHRHMNSAQKREAIRAYLEVRPIMTDHGAAIILGVSDKTVAAVRAAMNPPADPNSENPNNEGQPRDDERREASGRRARGPKPGSRRREDPPPAPGQRRHQRAEGRELWKDERVVSWGAARMAAGATRDDMVRESRDGAFGWPVPGAHLPQNAADRVRAIVEDREEAGRQQPPTRGRPKSWNGKSNDKRLRELRAGKGQDDYGELLRFQIRVHQACAALEPWEIVRDCNLDEVGIWRVTEVLDDLITLGEWYERTLAAVQGRLADEAVLSKIATLRDATGRTPEEAETMARVADRLERKLTSRLSA